MILKTQIKNEIIAYLRPLGYPNIETDRVMIELQNIYRFLELKNLLPGVSYATFQQAAHQALIFAQLRGM